MILNETESRTEQLLAVARSMMTAARTAPKAKGKDRLEIMTVYGEDMGTLVREMVRYGDESGMKFFHRDAGNVEQSDCVVIIGTTYGIFGFDCGFCGFPTCALKEEHPGVPCAFNTNDLGIAVGSAASIAADNRVDNRIMFSVGKAALNLGWLPGCGSAYGIVMSSSGKSPYFDRVVPVPKP